MYFMALLIHLEDLSWKRDENRIPFWLCL